MNAPSIERIALIHDWLVGYAGGGERVLEQMIELFPRADLYAAIDTLAPANRDFLHGKQPITSFAQRLPLVASHYRGFLPLLMFAMEQLDLSQHELVLSSSVSVARGVLTGPDQLHIAYVHSPMRYAWDLQHQYLREACLDRGVKSLLARWMLHRARFWDLRCANGVDYFIANSHFIARRIWKVYRRRAAVIHPPVDVERFTLRTRKDNFYLTASRLVPYKKIATVVEAFRLLPDRRLVVVGGGPEMARVKAAAGANVEVLGYQPAARLRELMQAASAFVFAAEEDFGIAPIEAQACGTPVIAYGRGGALESVRPPGHPAPTGLFFDAQTPASIAAAVREFERRQALFEPAACRENALRFSCERFRAQYQALVQRCWQAFSSGRPLPDTAEAHLGVVHAVPPAQRGADRAVLAATQTTWKAN
jgi:glycosyltransferase involved in cell wall biosynthesis